MFGASGFVGGYLLDALVASGRDVSALVRPGSEGKLRHREACRVVTGDIASPGAIDETLAGCQAAIYNIGILREFAGRGITFEALQFNRVVNVIRRCEEVGVSRFLLMSANGVRIGGTRYQDTKARAENAAFESELDVTVFRPSVIFGDPRGAMEIATQLCQQMVRPPLPAVSFEAVTMSPVYVKDVASAFVSALDRPETIGKTFALGGPDVLTWAEMIDIVARAVDKTKLKLPVPIPLMRFGAALFDWLPFYPVTRDQLTMLAEGNNADPSELAALIGRQPKAFTPKALEYLSKSRA